IRVVRGRLPGCSPLAWLSSRKNISLLVLKVQPSSGTNADLRNTPPLGVIQTMLPSRSMAARCVVPSSETAPAISVVGGAQGRAAGATVAPGRAGSPGSGSLGQACAPTSLTRSAAYAFDNRPAMGTAAKLGSP